MFAATLSSAESLARTGRSPTSAPPAASRGAAAPSGQRLTAVTTLVVWLGCVAVGALGLAVPYTRPQPAKPEPPPVQFEKLQIELAEPAPPLAASTPQPPDLSSPPPPAALAQIALPQPIAVAELSPTVAFAVPVDGPVRLVDPAHAGVTGRATEQTARAVQGTPVQSLVFGRGEGRQPAPTYPARASQLGQEGVVTVQFSVDEAGRVASVAASAPSPWALLNEAAVRTVRERWRFSPGALRNYEVAIQFRLKK